MRQLRMKQQLQFCVNRLIDSKGRQPLELVSISSPLRETMSLREAGITFLFLA